MKIHCKRYFKKKIIIIRKKKKRLEKYRFILVFIDPYSAENMADMHSNERRALQFQEEK